MFPAPADAILIAALSPRIFCADCDGGVVLGMDVWSNSMCKKRDIVTVCASDFQ